MTITERNDLITHLTCLLNDLPGSLFTMINVNGSSGPELHIVMVQRDNGYGSLTEPPTRATVIITYDELGEAMTRGWGYPQHLIRKRWQAALAEKRALS
jgi:hypothetical protein